jgi:hypothetical protein
MFSSSIPNNSRHIFVNVFGFYLICTASTNKPQHPHMVTLKSITASNGSNIPD